jgi:hypothetical protein
VREHGVENNTTFVSWIPQSLLKLSELGARTPLILSHWNMHRFGPAGQLLSSILCADALVFLLRHYSDASTINVGGERKKPADHCPYLYLWPALRN